MNRNDQKDAFILQLTSVYGFSREYAWAAWLSLSESDKPGGQLADHYCARFNISPVKG